MKSEWVGACAAMVFICGSSASAADYYVSAGAGAAFRPTYSTGVSEPTDPFGNRVTTNGQAIPFQENERTDFKTGFDLSVAVGRRFSLGARGALRVEAEFGYRSYQTGTSTVTSTPGQVYATTVNATLNTTSGLYQQRYSQTANLFYDLPAVASLIPYVGGGVGYQEGTQTSGDRLRTSHIVSGASQSNPVSTVHFDSTSEDAGTWLVETGVSFPLTSRLSLAPAYRFTQVFEGQKPVHVARVALRYHF